MTAAELAERLDGKPSGAGWMARCPAHEDRVPSLSITEGLEGRVLLHCHAGCTVAAILDPLGLTPRDLFDENGRGPHAPRSEEVAAYDYRDETDTLVYQVVRYIPKAFKQRRPDGQDGWIWNLRGVRRVLYRLPELLDRGEGAPVWVVEGEKDADALARHGLAATTNAGGVKKWRPEYGAALKRAHVIVVPDTDVPGLAHGEDVARQLHGTAASVRVVRLPRGKDVTEFLELGGTVTDLTTLAAAAPVWAPAGHDRRDAADRHGRDAVDAAAGGDPPGAAMAALAATPAPTGYTRAPAASPTDAETDDTDSGNSTRLVLLHGAQLHYIARWGTWLVWSPTEGRWQLDHHDVLVRELAKDVGRALKEAAAREDSKRLFAFALKSLNAHGVSGMVDLARGIPGILLEHEALDQDGWLLGVQNGVVDLRTGALRPADPGDLMTMQCPVAWDDGARAPRWDQALREWFPDAAVRAYVQRLAGSALVGAQPDHIFVILYGGGRNGKGTFVRALQHVLGPYATVAHLSLLVEQKYAQHDTVKAALFRTRLAVASETQRRVKLDEASVKNLTGGDIITARRMKENPWQFHPSHSLWLQTNHLPEIRGRDTGIWSRIRVVPWVTTFAERNQDRALDATLAAEAPGILCWLVQGCLEWQRLSLAEPEAVIRETLAYRQAEDVFTRFTADTGLAFDRGAKIEAGALQTLLTEWAHAEGIEPPRQELAAWLKDHHAAQRQPRETGADGAPRRVRYWVGIGLRDVDNPDAEATLL